MNYANIFTEDVVDALPKLPYPLSTATGMTFSPTQEQKDQYYLAKGWRKVTAIEAPKEGFRVAKYIIINVSATACELAVGSAINIAEEQQAQDAASAAAELSIKKEQVKGVGVDLSLVVLLNILNKRLMLLPPITPEDCMNEARKILKLGTGLLAAIVSVFFLSVLFTLGALPHVQRGLQVISTMPVSGGAPGPAYWKDTKTNYMVAAWDFDTTNGAGNCLNLYGAAATATNLGCVRGIAGTNALGRVNYAYYSDGTVNYFDLGTIPEISGESNVTVVMWFRILRFSTEANIDTYLSSVTGVSYQWLLRQGGGLGGTRFDLEAISTAGSGNYWRGYSTNSVMLPYSNKWAMLTLVVDRSAGNAADRMRVYLGTNSVLTDKSIVMTSPYLYSTVAVRLGNGGDRIQGYMDNVRIYSHLSDTGAVLTVSELAERMLYLDPENDLGNNAIGDP